MSRLPPALGRLSRGDSPSLTELANRDVVAFATQLIRRGGANLFTSGAYEPVTRMVTKIYNRKSARLDMLMLLPKLNVGTNTIALTLHGQQATLTGGAAWVTDGVKTDRTVSITQSVALPLPNLTQFSVIHISRGTDTFDGSATRLSVTGAANPGFFIRTHYNRLVSSSTGLYNDTSGSFDIINSSRSSMLIANVAPTVVWRVNGTSYSTSNVPPQLTGGTYNMLRLGARLETNGLTNVFGIFTHEFAMISERDLSDAYSDILGYYNEMLTELP